MCTNHGLNWPQYIKTVSKAEKEKKKNEKKKRTTAGTFLGSLMAYSIEKDYI